MRKIFRLFLALVLLSTLASAWGFKKGDTFTFNKEAFIPITDVKNNGGLATSKFFLKDYGWIVFVIEKIKKDVYHVNIITSLGVDTDKPFYMKEVRDGEFIRTTSDGHITKIHGDSLVFLKI